jgi:hypothetical protein
VVHAVKLIGDSLDFRVGQLSDDGGVVVEVLARVGYAGIDLRRAHNGKS